MNARDDGGPAFPLQWGSNFATGMTLRDYFAAKAMQATLACTDDKSEWPDQEMMAAAFYAWADAMLKERAK